MMGTLSLLGFAENKIKKDSSEGLLGISINNAYLKNITFRRIKYYTFKTFSKIINILKYEGGLIS
ncbi:MULTISPECIES: hypothetical protein [Borreliella]|uniref:hypothetical protein n=1 Tax=Borreliella TaxID=64895 RepID=UPI00165DBADC|nr:MULTISPECIES: hypothetical protein [Borreliella]WLN24576.1 hypothetical protein IDK87_04725 [Borreliella bavariensis]